MIIVNKKKLGLQRGGTFLENFPGFFGNFQKILEISKNFRNVYGHFLPLYNPTENKKHIVIILLHCKMIINKIIIF